MKEFLINELFKKSLDISTMDYKELEKYHNSIHIC